MAKARAKTKAKAKPKRALVEPIVLGATGLRQASFPIALAVSPDGTKIATGDFEGNVRVLDAPTGACVFEARWVARYHRGRHGIQKLVFSPDGAVLAALTGIGGHGNLCAGHLPTGATWFETATEYESVAYSPDGTQLAGITRGLVEILNARDGTPIQQVRLPEGCYAKDAILWAGALIVAKYYDQTAQRTEALVTIDADTLEVRARHEIGVDLVRAELAVGTDGKLFGMAEVSAHDAKQRDLRVVVIDPATGETTTKQVTGDFDGMSSTPALVPGLRAAVVGAAKDDEQLLVGIDTAAVIHRFPADTLYVAASADGTVIATSRGVALQLFDAAWTPRSSAPGLSSKVAAIGWRDDAAVITCDATSIRTWGPDGTPLAVLELGDAVALVDDGAVIIRDDCTVVVDLPSGTQRPGGIAKEHKYGAVTRDGTLLANRDYTNAKGHVLIWSFQRGTLARDIAAHAGTSVYGIAFSADGTRIASGAWEGQLAIHDVATGKSVATGHASRGYGQQALSFSPDGTLIASGDHARTVRLWRVSTGKVAHAMLHQRKYILATAFSPDGKLLASCDEASIRLWHTKSGEPAGVARVGATCLAFSPDGTKLAAGGAGEAHIFDVASLLTSSKGTPRRPRS